MTIRTPESLSLFIDLISDGVSVSEATTAIGGSPKSKIVFLWLKESEQASDFETPPAVSEPWCIVRDGIPQWFHVAYREAVAAGRVARSIRRTPIRAELTARLKAKRAGQVATVEPSLTEQHAPPRMVIDHYVSAPVVEPPPPAPRPRPSYAYRAPRIEGVHGENGPPQEGRFSMTADRPKSKAERRAGTIEFSDAGIKQW